MIPKSDDFNNPKNYHCISLLNCLTMIFTKIMNNKLKAWSEDKEVIQRFQSSFRNKCSCTDNLFVLNAIIQTKISLLTHKLFVAFFDFKRAFDFVDHSLLYNKLSSFGVSSKFIRILCSLYDAAHLKIKAVDKLTDPVDVNKGVLQGETMSPTLFDLFLADLENFLRRHGARGVSVDGTHKILVLTYADDLILFSDTPYDMNVILRVLKMYCDENLLIVNTKKTKVMIFHRGVITVLFQRGYLSDM